MSVNEWPERLWCENCQRELVPGRGNFYVIRIEAIADPCPPVISEEDLAEFDRPQLSQLIRELAQLSEEELLEQVYRRVTLYLCRSCYERWIEDPTGSLRQ